MLTGKHSEFLLFEEKEALHDGFHSMSKFCCRRGMMYRMCIICLLASMELIHTPNCSILYLHSNDTNSLKSSFLRKRRGKKYIYTEGNHNRQKLNDNCAYIVINNKP